MATQRTTWQWRLVDDIIAEADADDPGRFVYWREEGIEGVLWRRDVERGEPQEVRALLHPEREVSKATPLAGPSPKSADSPSSRQGQPKTTIQRSGAGPA